MTTNNKSFAISTTISKKELQNIGGMKNQEEIQAFIDDRQSKKGVKDPNKPNVHAEAKQAYLDKLKMTDGQLDSHPLYAELMKYIEFFGLEACLNKIKAEGGIPVTPSRLDTNSVQPSMQEVDIEKHFDILTSKMQKAIHSTLQSTISSTINGAFKNQKTIEDFSEKIAEELQDKLTIKPPTSGDGSDQDGDSTKGNEEGTEQKVETPKLDDDFMNQASLGI